MSEEGELKKRRQGFNFIVHQACNYSCRLDNKMFPKPVRTQEFVSMKDIDEARKEFVELARELADPVAMDAYEELVAEGAAGPYVKLVVALKKWFGGGKADGE